ncbi:hypothetical protein F8388_026094, partial [Cannabis sativa]
MDALLVPTDNNELLGSDILPNKRRRKKSIVWEHFVVKKLMLNTLGPIVNSAKSLLLTLLARSWQEPAILNVILPWGSVHNIAQDALGIMREVICKIRENVKYVKTSETHEDKFLELKQQLQVPSMKDLVIDDQTKWNSTYHMLVAACELQEVFACLDTSDPDYKITPSIDEWR